MPEGQHLSISEAARRLGVERQWVSKRLEAGEFPHVRKGQRVWIDESAIDAYLERVRLGAGDMPLGRLPPKPKLAIGELAALAEAGWSDEQIADALRPRATAEKVAGWRQDGAPNYWATRLRWLVRDRLDKT